MTTPTTRTIVFDRIGDRILPEHLWLRFPVPEEAATPDDVFEFINVIAPLVLLSVPEEVGPVYIGATKDADGFPEEIGVATVKFGDVRLGQVLTSNDDMDADLGPNADPDLGPHWA